MNAVQTIIGFVVRAERILDEINQILLDAEYWNASRRPGEAAIDPDPDGKLAEAKRYLEEFIRVNMAKVKVQ